MDSTISRPASDKRKGLSLLAGTFLAALLAVVFGACLWTILDATRPVGPKAAFSKANAFFQPTPMKASF